MGLCVSVPVCAATMRMADHLKTSTDVMQSMSKLIRYPEVAKVVNSKQTVRLPNQRFEPLSHESFLHSAISITCLCAVLCLSIPFSLRQMGEMAGEMTKMGLIEEMVSDAVDSMDAAGSYGQTGSRRMNPQTDKTLTDRRHTPAINPPTRVCVCLSVCLFGHCRCGGGGRRRGAEGAVRGSRRRTGPAPRRGRQAARTGTATS